jgi:hypothetical protein
LALRFCHKMFLLIVRSLLFTITHIIGDRAILVNHDRQKELKQNQ